jgi:selenocysteine lyase/cysteine desulfurase
MARAALQQILDWGGIGALSSRLGALTAHLHDALSRHGLLEGLRTPHAPHLCAWVPPAGARDHVVQALGKERIIAALRGDGIRIAPHLHVTAGDLDRLARVLAAAC